MVDRKNAAVEERARALYREAAEDLDPAARSRLAEARENAIRSGSGLARTGSWALAAAAAALGAIVLALVLNTAGQPDFDSIAEAGANETEMDLFLAEDNLEMIAELDFYLWLDAEPDAG